MDDGVRLDSLFLTFVLCLNDFTVAVILRLVIVFLLATGIPFSFSTMLLQYSYVIVSLILKVYLVLGGLGFLITAVLFFSDVEFCILVIVLNFFSTIIEELLFSDLFSLVLVCLLSFHCTTPALCFASISSPFTTPASTSR